MQIDEGTTTIAPVERPLEDGWTLPASWYSDPNALALEREHIFASAWQYAGPLEWVADRGCFFAAQVGRVPVAIVRGKDGALRGFVNVCRHRGHLVVSGEAAARRSSARTTRGPTTSTERCGRRPAPSASQGSTRRVSRSFPCPSARGDLRLRESRPAAATPLEEALGDLPSIVAASGIDLDAVRFHSHHEWPIEANWKVVMENFLECYHCPTAHPGFSKVIDVAPDAYRLQVHPTFSSQVGSVRESALSGNGRAAYTPRSDVAQAQYHFLFPVTTVNIAPGIPNIGLERYIPDGPARTIEVTDYYFGTDASDEEIAELMAWDSQVAEEDVSLVQSVQRGLESGAVRRGA